MRWYGLTQLLKRRDGVQQIIPELLLFVENFGAQNKVGKKAACTGLANNMFGRSASFILSVNTRILATIKFYGKPRSLLVFLKLFLAYAIKKHKKNVPFLAGGVYHGCKSSVDHARDTLFLKDKEINRT